MGQLTYVGHATTRIQLGEGSVVTDPVLRRWIGPLRRQAPAPRAETWPTPDAALISHLHRDHLDLRSLRRLPEATPLVVPRGAAGVVATAGDRVVREIALGETIALGDIEVTAVPAVHDQRRAPWTSVTAEAIGYVISGEGRRVYFAGDTDVFDGMSDLGPLDVALVPVWGWGPSLGPGHLDPESAARALALLHPRIAVPIHWGTFYPLGIRRLRPHRLTRPPHEFAAFAAEIAPEVEVHVLEPGEMMEL